MSGERTQLHELIAAELHRPVLPGVEVVVEALRRRYGDAVQAVLFYGSCLRTGRIDDNILDVYVLVDRYRAAYANRRLALFNALLPPNVFYLECPWQDRVIRAKYAVISVDDFVAGTSLSCFNVSLWARFAQPCVLAYARDARAAHVTETAVAAAVVTFITRAVPLAPPVFSAAQLWEAGLLASYSAELRPERAAAVQQLVSNNLQRYQYVTDAACGEAGGVPASVHGTGDPVYYAARLSRLGRFCGRQAWYVRRIQGKILNFLRLIKAVFTFDGGVDYVLWKIRRHSGVNIEVSPRLRRHPLIACWWILWRAYRLGLRRQS